MKRISLVTFLVLLCLSLTVMGQKLNTDVVEIGQNDSLKIFLFDNLNCTYRECAQSYCVVKVDSAYFWFEGGIKGYYLNNNPFFTGSYVNGKKQGEFKMMYPDGSLKCRGYYKDDVRDSIWTYYYRGNSLHMVVHFKNGYEYLKEFYNKKGQHLVENFEGKFEDDVQNSAVFGTPFKFKGLVKNGRFESEWKIYLSGILIGTEYFAGGLFKKGISYTEFGNQENNDQISSFTGLDIFQSLGIRRPTVCSNFWPTPFKLTYEKSIEENLNKLLSGKVLKNSWYLVSFGVTGGMKLKDFKIISSVKNGIAQELEQAFLSTRLKKGYFKMKGREFNFFPVKVLDQKISLWEL